MYIFVNLRETSKITTNVWPRSISGVVPWLEMNKWKPISATEGRKSYKLDFLNYYVFS